MVSKQRSLFDAPYYQGMTESHKTIFSNLVVVLREQVNGKLSPAQLAGLATLILALDRLPLTTPGLDCTLTLKRILDDMHPMGRSYLSHMIMASGSSIEISVGGVIYGDAGPDGFTDFQLYVTADDDPYEADLWEAIAWMSEFRDSFVLDGVELKIVDRSRIARKVWEKDDGWQYWDLLAAEQERARAAEEEDDPWDEQAAES